MKKIKVERFEAADGTIHDSEAAALKHEASLEPEHIRVSRVFKSVTPEMIQAAMEYDIKVPGGRDLGDMIEDIARVCAQSRIAGGGAKRKVTPKEEKKDGAPKVGEAKPEEINVDGVDVTSNRAKDTPRYPTSENRFPAHTAAGGPANSNAG